MIKRYWVLDKDATDNGIDYCVECFANQADAIASAKNRADECGVRPMALDAAIEKWCFKYWEPAELLAAWDDEHMTVLVIDYGPRLGLEPSQ